MLSFQKKVRPVIVTKKASNVLPTVLHASQGRTAGVHTDESLPIPGPAFSTLLYSQPHLDQEWGWMPEADPGEDTISYCALQRRLWGVKIYFSTV